MKVKIKSIDEISNDSKNLTFLKKIIIIKM